MCEFFREKSQIVILSTFDQRELNFLYYIDENVYSVRKRAFFTLSCTLQGLQIEAFQQPYSKCKCEKPISAEKLKITFAKIQIWPPNCFPKWFGPKQIEAILWFN